MNKKLNNSKYSTASTLHIVWEVELIKNLNNDNNQPS